MPNIDILLFDYRLQPETGFLLGCQATVRLSNYRRIPFPIWNRMDYYNLSSWLSAVLPPLFVFAEISFPEYSNGVSGLLGLDTDADPYRGGRGKRGEQSRPRVGRLNPGERVECERAGRSRLQKDHQFISSRRRIRTQRPGLSGLFPADWMVCMYVPAHCSGRYYSILLYNLCRWTQKASYYFEPRWSTIYLVY